MLVGWAFDPFFPSWSGRVEQRIRCPVIHPICLAPLCSVLLARINQQPIEWNFQHHPTTLSCPARAVLSDLCVVARRLLCLMPRWLPRLPLGWLPAVGLTL